MKNKILVNLAKFAVAIVLAMVMFVPSVAGTANVTTTASAEEGKIADLFMIAGQSNAAGSTRKDSTPNGMETYYAPKQNVLYYGETHRTTTSGQGSSYKRFTLSPVQHGCGYSINHVGFELGLANVLNEMEEYQGDDRKAIIFKSAAGGTSVFPETMPDQYGNWYPRSLWDKDYYTEHFNYHTGLQYRAFMDNLKNLMSLLKEEGYTQVNVKGLFWMQGCSDRGRVVEYKTIVKTMIKDMREDIGEIVGYDCSEMPFYIGEISETFGSALESNVKLNLDMIECQHQIAGEMKGVYVAEIKQYHINELDRFGNNVVLGSDSAHYNYNDVVALGEDFADLYLDTFGKTNSYVQVDVDQTEVSIPDLYRLTFTGKYCGNYGPDSQEVTFDLRVSTAQKLVSVDATNAKIELAGISYHENNDKIYSYKITDLQENVGVQLKLAQNKSYKVNVTCADETYGATPNSKYIERAYGGYRYTLKTFPESYGAVEKFIINGTEVLGAIDQEIFTFEDLELYVKEGDTAINIEIVYGEYEAVKAKLENLNNAGGNEEGGNEQGGTEQGGSSAENGSGCGATSSASLLGLLAICLGGLLVLKRR